MLGMLIGPIAEIAKSWVGGKVAVSKAKAEARLEATRAETEVMKKVQQVSWTGTKQWLRLLILAGRMNG